MNDEQYEKDRDEKGYKYELEQQVDSALGYLGIVTDSELVSVLNHIEGMRE